MRLLFIRFSSIGDIVFTTPCYSLCKAADTRRRDPFFDQGFYESGDRSQSIYRSFPLF